MTDGRLLLGIVTPICVGDIVVALRFSPLAARSRNEVGAPPKSSAIDPVAARRFARIMLIAAPLMWLLAAALTFGLFGPVKNITPIAF